VRILIAVDGSAECEASLRIGARWVGVLDAHVYLLQVIDGLASTRACVNHESQCAESVEAQVLAMKKARIYLDQLVSRYELPAHRTRCLVGQSDSAAKEIITIAQNNGIDLIVMSSHCRSWLGQSIQGGVCSEVVYSRVCPVLCVPLVGVQTGP
jgi:nucleotide-binding universal stress UspA family protein